MGKSGLDEFSNLFLGHPRNEWWLISRINAYSHHTQTNFLIHHILICCKTTDFVQHLIDVDIEIIFLKVETCDGISIYTTTIPIIYLLDCSQKNNKCPF